MYVKAFRTPFPLYRLRISSQPACWGLTTDIVLDWTRELWSRTQGWVWWTGSPWGQDQNSHFCWWLWWQCPVHEDHNSLKNWCAVCIPESSERSVCSLGQRRRLDFTRNCIDCVASYPVLNVAVTWYSIVYLTFFPWKLISNLAVYRQLNSNTGNLKIIGIWLWCIYFLHCFL